LKYSANIYIHKSNSIGTDDGRLENQNASTVEVEKSNERLNLAQLYVLCCKQNGMTY
jgi:hypothetical protein